MSVSNLICKKKLLTIYFKKNKKQKQRYEENMQPVDMLIYIINISGQLQRYAGS